MKYMKSDPHTQSCWKVLQRKARKKIVLETEFWQKRDKDGKGKSEGKTANKFNEELFPKFYFKSANFKLWR
jgi:hypothetical protein